MENQSSLTKYYLLSVLSKRGMHGYELITEIEKITGKKPSAGQIYPALKHLTSSGHLSLKTRMEGNKKIKSYTITKSGENLLRIMNKRFSILIESVLKARIKVCAHCNCEIISGAVTKKIGKTKHDFCCISCASSFLKKQ